ncbi:MAG: rhomboid family intramembrane serine protease [Azospirillaceae bacterium]
MILVLSDGNPRVHIKTPWVNHGLIVLCCVVFAGQYFLDAPSILDYGFFPAQFFDAAAMPPPLADTPWWLRAVTAVFMHGDLLHLAGNMLILWVFGDNVEDAVGHGRYLGFFVAIGVLGNLAHGVMSAIPMTPVIGASGAIAGVMGAYLLLHPRAWVLVIILGRLPLVVPAGLAVGAHILINLYFGFEPLLASVKDVADTGVAWWAHIGGFAGGMALIGLIRKPDVALFQPSARYGSYGVSGVFRWLLAPTDSAYDRMADRQVLVIAKALAFGVTVFIVLGLL